MKKPLLDPEPKATTQHVQRKHSLRWHPAVETESLEHPQKARAARISAPLAGPTLASGPDPSALVCLGQTYSPFRLYPTESFPFQRVIILACLHQSSLLTFVSPAGIPHMFGLWLHSSLVSRTDQYNNKKASVISLGI